MTIGKGTKSGKALRGFIEEIEGVRERKKQLGEAEKAIFAEAKAADFDTKTIRKLLQLRQTDKAKRDEAQAFLDTYMHAIGMEDEPPPLFAALEKAGADLAKREEAIEFIKSIVPQSGEIILKIGGAPVRCWRDADGNAHSEDVTAAEPAPKSARAADDDDDVTSSYPPSPSARTVSRSHIDDVVARAEAAAKAKRDKLAAHDA